MGRILARTGGLGVVTPGAKTHRLRVDGDPRHDLSRLEGRGERVDAARMEGALFVSRLAP